MRAQVGRRGSESCCRPDAEYDLYVSHKCHCGSPVDARGLHSFVCYKAPGRSARHHALNDLVARSFSSAGVSMTKRASRIIPVERKMTRWHLTGALAERQVVVLGHHGHLLTGRVTRRQSISPGSAAELAATRKEDKYVDLGARYIFEPIFIETLGVFNASARQLVADLGRRISINTGEAREASYLFQRIFVLVQRFNAVLLHDSLLAADSTDWGSYPPLYCLVNF